MRARHRNSKSEREKDKAAFKVKLLLPSLGLGCNGCNQRETLGHCWEGVLTSVLVGKFPALIFMRFKTYTLTRTKLREERKRERGAS